MTKSRRKSVILPVVLIILSLGIIIGTTLAYFTDARSSQSPVNFGKIEISVDDAFTESISLTDALPGDKITDRISFSKAIDSEPMYVRAKVYFETDSIEPSILTLVEELNTYDISVATSSSDYAWSERYGEYFYLVSASNSEQAYLLEDTSEIVLSNGFEIPRELKQSQDYGQYFAQVNLMLEVQAIQNTGTNDLYEVDAIFEDVFGGSLYDNILTINLEDSFMYVTPGTLSNVIIQNSELQNKYNFFYDQDLAEPVALTDNLLGGDVIYTQPVTQGLIYTPIESASGAYGGPSNANSVTEYRVGDGTTSEGNAMPSSVTDKNIVIANNYYDGSVLHPVTEIGQYSFFRKGLFTSVTIPDSVTSIGFGAFSYCGGLTSITVSADNITYDSRENCNAIVETASNTLITGCKNTVILDSVTNIGNYAFSGCSGLTRVTIPDSVTSIGDNAFSGCSDLTNITIPDSVTSIGDSAFMSCSGLTSITIPDSVTSIGDNAFSYCSSLTSVTIPDSVTSIGQNAFIGCRGLTSVSLGNSVTSIGDSAFFNCGGLTSIIIPDSVTSIGYNAFNGCSGLTSLTIGSGVTSIGGRAFASCSGLKNVYYLGSSAKWGSISISSNNNTALTDANRYYIEFDENNQIVVADKNNPTVTAGDTTYKVSYDNTDPSKVVATITFYNNNNYVVVATKDLIV